MTLETFLTIASFAMAVGGLAALLLPSTKKKETVLAVVLAALLATTGVALYQHSKREALLKQVEEKVIEVLTQGPMTFDHLYEKLFPLPFPTVSEALFRAVEKKHIGHEMLELRVNGKPVMVRNYFVAP